MWVVGESILCACVCECKSVVKYYVSVRMCCKCVI